MTAPTHIAFSTVLYLYLCTVFRIPLAFGVALLSAMASLLPDIDISSSGIGRRLKFLSVWIEKRFGHRTITHSFLGTFGIAVMASPLLLAGIPTYAFFVAGYFSHPFLDQFSKEGVQFYWPSPKWGVFPAHEEYRLEVGSPAEHVLLAGLIVLALMLYPLASVGMDRALHWMLANISGAVKDYHAFSPHYQVQAELKGTYKKIEKEVEGTYPVVDALSEYSLLMEINDKLCVVGTTAEAHIVPSSIRIQKAGKIVRYTQAIPMDGHTLGELSRLKGVEHRLFGTFKVLSHFDVPVEVIAFNPVTRSGSTLTFDHATYADIEALGLEKVPVLTSVLLLETVLPADSLFRPFSFSQAKMAVFPVEVSIAAKEDVMVKPGQQVLPGTVLVANSEKLRDITVLESDIETERKLRVQKSFEFSVQDQELERQISSVKEETGSVRTKLEAFQKSIGFEKEIATVQRSLEKLEAQKHSLLGRRKELLLKDASDRLRYQQRVTEILAKKESLEASAFTRAEFETEVVNVEFQKNKCVLYLRRLENAPQKGD